MVTSDEVAASVAGQTVATRFRETVRSHPDRVALRWKDGDSRGRSRRPGSCTASAWC